MKEKYKCHTCGGTGKIIVSSVDNDYITTCKECKGTGKRLITITLEEYENLTIVNYNWLAGGIKNNT